MYLLYFLLVLFGKTHFFNTQPLSSQTLGDAFSIKEDFNQTCVEGIPQGWYIFGVAGNQQWACTTFGHKDIHTKSGQSNALQINGYAGTALKNENWLISPEYDLDNFQYPLLSFYSRVAFDGPRPKLYVSTDYDTGDPTSSQWIPLGDRFARGDEWTYTGKINLAPFKTHPIRLAIVYFSSPEQGAARWTLDDWTITNADKPPKPFLSTNLGNTDYMHFGTVPLGQASTEIKGFEFLLADPVGDLNIQVAEGFGISKTPNGFTRSLSYTAEEAGQNNRLWIRFEPQSDGAFHGPVSFSFADTLQQVSFLSGSTLSQEKTLDIVTWNLFWFGSDLPYQGPSDPGLQLENVSRLIQSINADIYALQEITNLNQFDKLLATLEGYEAVISPAVSYGPEAFDSAQKLAFLYKIATVKPLSSRALLQGVTSEALAEYPSDPNRFWASGRLPFLMEAETRVDGIQQTISLVNLHARSNGGGESATNPRYAMRKYDLAVLKDSLDHYYGKEPLLILGDFNDDLDKTISDTSASTVSGSETSFIHFMLDQENYFPVTLALSQAGLRSYILSEDIIDHMILSHELAESYLSQSARIVVPDRGWTNFLTNTSDHLPVKIRLDPKKLLANSLILGVSDADDSDDIQIYPNPANQILFVHQIGPSHSVSLINQWGQTMETRDSREGTVFFDVSNLAGGVYLIHVQRKQAHDIFKKVIIQK